ncbi:MAG: hypothetical protein ACREP9_14465, partial [Candidatus Dormibacteraceae bacterium]
CLGGELREQFAQDQRELDWMGKRVYRLIDPVVGLAGNALATRADRWLNSFEDQLKYLVEPLPELLSLRGIFKERRK